ADRVVLDFDCEIIGIVGPNGCGKSNIVDAVRWVMGEQSAKSLRGGAMHDVLFAGTDNRKPLNYAEVSLSFTDVGDELPIAYEEITITRRLHRNGESEYLINKDLVRLKDIQSLFLGTGIGKNAFSIFEQGKLDQVIHLNPMERRAIFDEAAGTSRFLQRKKESVRKLAVVAENYVRVHDVHAEIEKQTKQLKKQASQAKSYQENKECLRELEKKVLIFKWKGIAEKNRELGEKFRSIEGSLKESQDKHTQLEDHLAQTKSECMAEELLAKQLQKDLSQSETKMRVQEAEITQQRHRLLEIKKQEENVKNHLQLLGKEREEHLQEIQRKKILLQ